MTFDELIEKLDNMRLELGHGKENDNCREFYNTAITDIQVAILDNRSALEAGMRGVLRFRWEELPTCANGWYVLIGLNGIGLTDGARLTYYIFYTKTQCEIFAKSLGMPAVFVEADDD